jgi:outer membrane protein OmpA-like peptidoglycan-associated protein
MGRNLPPYSVPNAFSPQVGNVNYETNLSVSSVIDSPNDLVSTNNSANNLYSLNEYGPEGGFSQPISLAGPPLPVEPNKGPYDPSDTVLDLVNEFFIDAAYTQNVYGPEGGFKDLVVITDVINSGKIYLPYWDPPTFTPSTYSPYEILFNNNPTGNNGNLSQDSFIAQIGAKQLKGYFEDRIAAEITQFTVGRVNLDSLSDPFTASLIATGRQPFIEKNWKITIPENPAVAAVSFANRLTGTYFPVSFIPGDYFDSTTPKTSNNEGALTTANNLTGGLLGPILNKYRNPSEIFLANTGRGQRSILFGNIDYNKYKPNYNRGIIGNIISNADGGARYYVGDSTTEPSKIVSPPNQLPVSPEGKQIDTIVYGPSELGKLYEGNDDKLNFGLNGKSYTNSSSVSGDFVWTSPKYKDNAGFNVGVGGDKKSSNDVFNSIGNYRTNESTNVTFKEGSILDQTQRIIDAADKAEGANRLKHVGNAMNQVSKVFNDGYKELTKGSQVIAHYDSVNTNSNTISTNGVEVGREYCRIFQKDTPYLTYSDLQKTDGITTAGRKFSYSIFDNTYNLNIAPLRGTGSTNIINNKVKKYMFSIENLAWRTSDRPGFTYDELPACERGPNGGRIMWFPPYDISFSDDSKPDFNATNFLGRPEPIYTYKNTSRSGTLSWKIIVDSPASLNTIIEKQLENIGQEKIDTIMDSFFAGCVKYDLYTLAEKYNQIPTSALYTYQELLNSPNLTQEELEQITSEIPSQATVTNGQSGEPQNGGGAQTTVEVEKPDPFIGFEGLGFYFYNDIPKGNPNTTTATSFVTLYDEYKNSLFQKTIQNAPNSVYVGDKTNVYTKDQIQTFLNSVVVGNYDKFSKQFLEAMEQVVIKDGGTVKLSLVGSASAIGDEGYNKRLSQRRISSVQVWLESQVFSNGRPYKDYIGTQIIYSSIEPKGEVETIPKSEIGSDYNPINCNTIPKELTTNAETINAKVNSIPAIACRRVMLKKIEVTYPTPVETTTTTQQITPTVEIPGGGGNIPVLPKKPIPQVTISQKVKEGISKKILRQLFSECDYFEVIKDTNPMVYSSIKDKIKYFNPAFHSMTPEGLNSRLTFLNQCVRPGQTIPIIGPDGRPKYNDAQNTAFGAPPILVLRIGDFYHTKIVPNNLSFAYDPLLFDLNPEGIGVQPMVVKVTLGFNIIGGMGLKEPVEQLQNALSFNYYANTEIYDERSTATEDVYERDKNLVAKIVNKQPTVTTASVNNEIPQKGGNTIGEIISTNTTGTIQIGEIQYDKLMLKLSKQTNEYFKVIFNQLETLNKTTNYGILQLILDKTKYKTGNILNNTQPKEINIIGKPDDITQKINKLTQQVIDDIDNGTNPIVAQALSNPTKTLKTIRDLKEELKKSVREVSGDINGDVIGPVNEMTKYQEEYVQTFKELDAIVFGIDGVKQDTGTIKLYDLLFNQPILNNITDKYNNVGNKLTEYIGFLIGENIFSEYFKNTSTFKPIGSGLNGDENLRYFMIMTPIFTNLDKFNNFRERILNLESIRDNLTFQSNLALFIDDIQDKYQTEYMSEILLFDTVKLSEKYKQFENFELVDITGLKTEYTTDVPPTTQQQNQQIMNNVYSKVNTNNNDTFNGKIKFN